MIPKKIHYCWFGRGEKPKLALRCIESWKKYCPDYELTEWNEDNFDFSAHPYLSYCLQNRKWAFLSDFARLIAVRDHGGIYFDTDVEVLRSFDPLLGNEAFYGFENREFIATGLGFGAEAGHPTVTAMAAQYEALAPDRNGDYPLIVCPRLNTDALLPFGLIGNGKRQTVGGALILPPEVLNPYDDPTGRLNRTGNTYSIHWYSKSWLSKSVILRSKLTKPLHRIFGTDCFRKRK